MNSFQLPKVIEIDGVVELFRNDTFGQPWPIEKISVTYDSAKLILPDSLTYLRESWLLRNINERIDSKISIRSIDQVGENKLNFTLQSTTWDQVRPLHEAYASLSSKTRAEIENGHIVTPNIGVVHVIACTSDGWIAMFCRSSDSHYHPNRWSATFEEGLSTEDAVDNDFFRRAARRGLAEEVAEELIAVPLECFKLMSVVTERAINNPAVIVLVELPFTKDDLPIKHPSDELLSGSLTFIQLNSSALRDAIACTNTPNKGLWHPSSRFRLLVVLAKYFGEDSAAAAISGSN